MDKFQEWHKLLKLIQEETESLSRPTRRKEIETVISKINAQVQMDSLLNFAKYLKEDFHKYLKNTSKL